MSLIHVGSGSMKNIRSQSLTSINYVPCLHAQNEFHDVADLLYKLTRRDRGLEDKGNGGCYVRIVPLRYRSFINVQADIP